MNQKLLKFLTKPQTPQANQSKRPKEGNLRSSKQSEKELPQKPPSKQDVNNKQASSLLYQPPDLTQHEFHEILENAPLIIDTIPMRTSQEKHKDLEESPIKLNDPSLIFTEDISFKKKGESPIKLYSRKNSKDITNAGGVLSNSSNAGSFLSTDNKPKEVRKTTSSKMGSHKNRFANRLKGSASSKIQGNLPSESVIIGPNSNEK